MTASVRLRPLEWILLFLLSVLWGGSFFFSKVAVAELPPLTLVFFRVSIAAIILVFFLVIRGIELPRGWSVWCAFFVMGMINNVIPFSLLFWGQITISSGLASILNATTPMFTIIVAHLLTQDEKITPLRLLGVGLGFAGVAVMLGSGASVNGADASLAMIACLVAALSYGFAGVFGKRFAKLKVAPAQVAFGQLSASTVWMIPLVLLIDGVPMVQTYSTTSMMSVLMLAVLCTALAYIIFFHILSVGGATNISLVTLLVPVSAIILGAIFLNEQLALSHYIGMTLIALGLLAIDGRVFGRFSAGPASR